MPDLVRSVHGPAWEVLTEGIHLEVGEAICRLPNFIGTNEDDYDRTYRNYYYAPLSESRPTPDTSEIVEVLRPFAEIAELYDDAEDDTWEVWRDGPTVPAMRSNLELHYMRRARSLLAKLGAG